jgi:hypothetical protein
MMSHDEFSFCAGLRRDLQPGNDLRPLLADKVGPWRMYDNAATAMDGL